MCNWAVVDSASVITSSGPALLHVVRRSTLSVGRKEKCRLRMCRFPVGPFYSREVSVSVGNNGPKIDVCIRQGDRRNTS